MYDNGNKENDVDKKYCRANGISSNLNSFCQSLRLDDRCYNIRKYKNISDGNICTVSQKNWTLFLFHCLSNAMHGQNMNLPACVCLSVCVSVTLSVNSPTGQTPQRIFTVDSLKDADLRKDMPFGGLDNE